ncbi:hypothetical protein ACMZ33_002585 [Escherichia coli]
MFSEVMRYILDLGPTVMLPIVIIIFSKILGMKAGDCFKAGEAAHEKRENVSR